MCDRHVPFLSSPHVLQSPDIEILAYDLTVKRLLKIGMSLYVCSPLDLPRGYPSELASFKFDPEFPVRGLFFDKMYGNLMKVWCPWLHAALHTLAARRVRQYSCGLSWTTSLESVGD